MAGLIFIQVDATYNFYLENASLYIFFFLALCEQRTTTLIKAVR